MQAQPLCSVPPAACCTIIHTAPSGCCVPDYLIGHVPIPFPPPISGHQWSRASLYAWPRLVTTALLWFAASSPYYHRPDQTCSEPSRSIASGAAHSHPATYVALTNTVTRRSKRCSNLGHPEPYRSTRASAHYFSYPTTLRKELHGRENGSSVSSNIIRWPDSGTHASTPAILFQGGIPVLVRSGGSMSPVRG
jgi:hypothetical protein